MAIDNRKRKISQDPEIQKIVTEDTIEETAEEIVPEETVEEPTEETQEDINLDKDETVEETVETVEETPAPAPVKETKEDIDYKERYSESSREALTLHFKNKQLTETIDQATNLPEPTDEELTAYAKNNGAEYEYLDDFQKNLLKKTLINEKRFQLISETNVQAKNYQQWVEKVDSFIDSPEVVNEFPDIEDNAEDFRRFCIKKDRHGMVLRDLASSFLYGLVTSSKLPKKTGSVLATQGGAVTVEKPVGLTDQDAARIRIQDPREYRRLVKAGKIKIEI